MSNVTLNNQGHKFIINGREYLVSKGVNANLEELTVTQNGTYTGEHIDGDVIIHHSQYPYTELNLNDWTTFDIPTNIVGYFSEIRTQIEVDDMTYVSTWSLSEIADYTSGMNYEDATRIRHTDDTNLYLAKTRNKFYFYQEANVSTYRVEDIIAKSVQKDVDGFSKVVVDVEGGGASIDWKLNNKKVASTGGSYITTNLDDELDENSWYIFSFSDTSGAGTSSDYDKITFMHYYSSGNEQFTFNGHSDIAQITLTPTTVSLSSYGGNYRDIYCKISKLDTTDRIYT